MPKFCANLSVLFTEVPLMARFKAAKEAGFDAVEVLDPYDAPVQDMRDQLVWNGQKMVLINCPPPNYAGGAVGYAAVPGSRFQQDFKRTLRYAQALKSTFIHVMAGQAEGPAARATFVENLAWAAEVAGKQKLTIEPLNADDRPGYFLNALDQSVGILQDVGAANVGLQFDAYHVAKIHGDVPGKWRQVQDHVMHVQVGQVPDRSEPMGEGTDFPGFFQLLDDSGYAGWVSAEYHPKAGTEAGLGWMNG